MPSLLITGQKCMVLELKLREDEKCNLSVYAHSTQESDGSESVCLFSQKMDASHVFDRNGAVPQHWPQTVDIILTRETPRESFRFQGTTTRDKYNHFQTLVFNDRNWERVE